MNAIDVIDVTNKPVRKIGPMQFQTIPREGDWIEMLNGTEINIYGVVTVSHTISDSIELYVSYLGTKDEAIDMFSGDI